MQEIINGMQNAFQMAGGSAGLSALFLAGLLALWHFKFDSNINSSIINDLFWFAIISLVVVTNPIYIWAVNHFWPELSKGNMLFWILPVVPLIVYVATFIISRLDNKFKRIAFTIGLFVIMVLATTTSYDPNEINLVKTSSYIEDKEAIVLAKLSDYIDKKGKDSILIWGSDEVMQAARLGDSRIRTLYGKELYEGVVDPQMRVSYDDWYSIVYKRMQDGAAKIDDIIVIAESASVDAIILDTATFNSNSVEISSSLNMSYYLMYSDSFYTVYAKERNK